MQAIGFLVTLSENEGIEVKLICQTVESAPERILMTGTMTCRQESESRNSKIRKNLLSLCLILQKQISRDEKVDIFTLRHLIGGRGSSFSHPHRVRARGRDAFWLELLEANTSLFLSSFLPPLKSSSAVGKR